MENSNYEDFKHRASAIGSYIGKKHTLINKGGLDEICIGWKEEFRSVYTDKGKEQEALAREMYAEVFSKEEEFVKMFNKNVQNDHVTGTPDIVHGDIVVDTKIAFDRKSFRKAEPSWNYIWQLKCYMWLLGLNKARLFYCMVPTPDWIMAKLEQKLFWNGDYTTTESPDYLTDKEELHKMHDISHLELHQKFKFWDFELDLHDIDVMTRIVNESREYMRSADATEDQLFEQNRLLLLGKK